LRIVSCITREANYVELARLAKYYACYSYTPKGLNPPLASPSFIF